MLTHAAERERAFITRESRYRGLTRPRVEYRAERERSLIDCSRESMVGGGGGCVFFSGSARKIGWYKMDSDGMERTVLCVCIY